MSTTDPRKLGGSIGEGSPYQSGGILVDVKDAVLLEGVDVVKLGAIREGTMDEEIVGLQLEGRINKSGGERAQVLFLTNADGAAGIVTELIGLAFRGGFGEEFLAQIRSRVEEMPQVPAAFYQALKGGKER